MSSSVRAAANVGHGVVWTVGMCTAGLTAYATTRSRPLFRRMTRMWAEGLARGWGMRVHAAGTEQLNPDGPYIFVSNHLSHTDIVALFVALPVDVGFLAKQELRKVPFLGAAMVAGGHVFIDRSAHKNAMKAMEAAAADVRAGASLVIFPEGTRGTSNEVQPFKSGAFHLAMSSGVPVVPVGLRGTRAIMPREGNVIWPGEVEVHVGTPVDPAHFDEAGPFADHVRHQVSRLAQMPLTSRRTRPSVPVPRSPG